MNKKLQFKSLLVVVALLLGGVSSVWAETKTFNFSTLASTNEWTNGTAYTSVVIEPITLTAGGGGNNGKYYTSDNSWRMYNGGTVTISASGNYSITNVTSTPNMEFTIADGKATLSCTATTKFTAITVTYNDASDSRTDTQLTISGNTTTASLGDAVTTPAATVTAGTTAVTNATVEWSSSNTEVAGIDKNSGAITLVSAGTTTIKASFVGDDTYKPSEASYTLTVNPAATTYTSMEALQKAVASLEEQKPVPAKITLNNIQVMHVSSSNAYISDGDKGALIYTKNHGLQVGQVLNGTINCQIQKYQGQTEITDFTTEGLTITNGTISALEKTPGNITAANQSLLVTLKEVAYDATNKVFTDGTNSIAYYDKFKTNVTLEDGKVYNITGIVIVNFETVEVCPRTADDVKLFVSDKTEPTSVWKSNGEEVSAICILKDESISVSFDTNSTGTASFESSNTEVATVDDNGVITLTGTVGVAVINASTEGNNEYLPSSATLSILVAEAEPEDGVFDFSLFQDYGSGMAPTSANVYVEEERTWKAGNITMKTDGKVRWYIGSSGGNTTYTLRLYGKAEPYSTMTISAPTGYVITAISGLGGSLKPNTGENKSGKWSGMAQEVTFTYENSSNSANMSCIKVTYTQPEFAMTMDGNFTTFCANMSIDFNNSSIKAYTAKVNKEGIVKLTEVVSGKVPAGKGVILKGESGSHNVKVIESADALSNNELTGVTEDTEVPWSVAVSETTTKYNYILQSGEFRKATGAILRAGKAYLYTTYDVTNTGESRLAIVVDGETTGIKALETVADKNVYDLQGRKVAAPTKGLYIINGKKMIVK
ncbi:MAG: hypothetical protein J6Y33_07865 [Prevotella sp.]|nr:hypothetical protein [Prevotella sp.]